MTAVGWLPADVGELFGTDATAEESYEVLTVDVPPATWISALETARDRLGCTYFDWLSAVDEPGTGFRVTAHIAALSPLRRLLLRTTIPHETPALPSAVGVYAGAAWHERETHEMFGIAFEGHPALDHLLLPDSFEGHPLRKDFVLAARVAKAWPGAKEPGESEHGGPKRRQMLPPGVPDPNEWGPLKGQLPPAPARPTRGPARAAGDRPARAAGERPVRRARTAGEGSASQAAAGDAATPAPAPAAPRRARSAGEGSASQAAEGSASQAAAGGAATPAPAPAAPRRARSAAKGSASQTTPGDTSPSSPAAPRRTRTAADGSASQTPSGSESPATGPESPPPGSDSPTTGSEAAAPGIETPTTGQPESPAAEAESPTPPAGPRRGRSASEGSSSQRAASDRGDSQPGRSARTPRSSDAPWHHARPAFDEPEPAPEPEPSPETAQSPTLEPSGDSETPEPTEPTETPEPTDNPEDPTGGTR
ncbi:MULTISPECIES: NADH-quinone oxidoreductase subunit C [Streptomyces]|uniref:NADH-quinone oxidoreductase subunit C n=1 Tax=Streptomyces TaxID=1883 RepID=UPI00287FC418|nr:NADH-quinone oxidoreductase subunit C [Streptomyces sp. CGMCC 4.1456]WNF64384.1 NADH-quinone oxidoreductase subunit C [Streptomyces sp. CGMCC 4.1456]